MNFRGSITKSRLLVVFVITIVLAGALSYGIWTSLAKTAEAFYASGQKYYEERKYPEAVIQLLNALQKDERHREARYLLALSYLNQSDATNAVTQLNSLLEFYPDDVAANLQLGGIYFRTGPSDSRFFQQARDKAAQILSKHPQNVEALILSGNALAALKNYPASIEQLEKAVIFSAQKANALVSLAAVQVQVKRYSDAERNFLKAVELEPKSKPALISLAGYYRFIGDAHKANAVYKDALLAYPTDKDIYFRVVDFHKQNGRLEDAESLLNDVQDKIPDDPQPSFALLNLFNENSRDAEAKALLKKLKLKFPQRIDVAITVALNSIQDQPELAREEIDRILKTEPNNPVAQTLLGELQFYTGDLKAAEVTFGQGPAIGGSYPQAHFFLGDIALKKGRIDEAQAHFEKSLELDPGYLPARVALADVFTKKGLLPEARIEVNKALEMLRTYIPARILKAVLDTQDKKYAEAEREFSQLLREDPDNPVLHEKMGFYYQLRGLAANAEESFSRALKLRPDSQQILQELVELYISENQTGRAIEKINSIPDGKKEAFQYELLGHAYSKAGKLTESEEAYRKALEREPGRTSSGFYLATAYIRAGKLEAGLNALDFVLKANPADGGAYALKGSIYESQGKLEEAKQNYRHALEINPKLVSAANNLAYLLVEEGRDLDGALRWAEAARKNDPENPLTADTLGWVQHKRGSNAAARAQLQFAVSADPGNPVFQYHLGVIYMETIELKQAEMALKRAVSSRTDFKERPLAEDALRRIAKANPS